MKAKKLLSILLFSLLACVMLAVYASAEVDSYYFAGDYLKYRAYNNETDLKNAISIDNGSLRIGDYTSTAAGTGQVAITLDPGTGRTSRGTVSEISTADYPYITTQFRTNHIGDLQFWPFGTSTTLRNTADGTKFAAGGDATFGTYNATANVNTSRNAWWTAKHSFKVSEMTLDGSTYWSENSDVFGETTDIKWRAKTDGTVTDKYEVVTINMTGTNATTDGQTRYADIKYIAMHNNAGALYGSEGMNAMIDLVAFLDEGIVYHAKPGATKAEIEEDLATYVAETIAAEFPGAVATLGYQFTDYTPTANEFKHFHWQITVEYKGVKAYDAALIKICPEFTMDGIGAQIRANDNASAALRFRFEFDMANTLITPTSYNVRIGAFVCPEGVELNTNATTNRVIVSPAGNFEATDDGIYKFNIVVTDIPGDANDTYESEYDTKVYVYPFVRYTAPGFGENNYIVGEPLIRSVNDVKEALNG